MGKGHLITFEGIDGSGKTTQARLLKERLDLCAAATLLVREPGGTAAGERIRELLLDQQIGLSTETEILLYAAARAELIRAVLKPAIAGGRMVICDRYIDSSLAYQGYGGGGDPGWIRELNDKLAGGLQPGITFLLDLSPEEAFRRRGRSRDRIEVRDRSYHERVRSGYLALAGREPGRIVTLDGRKPLSEIHDLIWGHLNSRFGPFSGEYGDDL